MLGKKDQNIYIPPKSPFENGGLGRKINFAPGTF